MRRALGAASPIHGLLCPIPSPFSPGTPCQFPPCLLGSHRPHSAFIPGTLLHQDKPDPLGFGNLSCLQVPQDLLGFQNNLSYLSSVVIPLFTPTAHPQGFFLLPVKPSGSLSSCQHVMRCEASTLGIGVLREDCLIMVGFFFFFFY